MRDYNVISPLRHDGKDYPIGTPVSLDDLTAAPLLAQRVIAAPEIAERALQDVLQGSDYLPTIIRLTETTSIPQKEIVERAFIASGLDHAGWNGLSDDDRELRITSSLRLLADQYRDPRLNEEGIGIQMAKAAAQQTERDNFAVDPQQPAAEVVVAQHQPAGDGAPVEGAAIVTDGGVKPAAIVDPVAATHTHTSHDGKGKRRS